MKIFDIILLNLTIVTFPVTIYLIYIAYIKTTNKRENNLIISLLIFSEIYFILKYGISIDNNLPLTIINIPLFILYFKDKKSTIIPVSLILILYNYSFYSKHLLIIIFEYLLYNFLFNKIKKINVIIIVFIVLKLVFIFLVTQKISPYIFIDLFILYIMSSIIIFFMQKAENMFKLNSNIKEIIKEKQIKETLFQITHEIKNPIAVCKGYLDMYDEKKIEDFKKYVPILKEEIDRTLILLEDFLAMNRKKLNKDIVDINYLLEEVIENMDILFKSKNIKLNLDITEEEIFINADYNRLTQVFINIFKNSIEALENKTNAEIKLWTKEDENNISIFIEDNGVGISKDILEKIKEPFYTTKLKGTGLGVSLSDEIINAHNGSLSYKSEQNKYTLVTIILPLEKAI